MGELNAINMVELTVTTSYCQIAITTMIIIIIIIIIIVVIMIIIKNNNNNDVIPSQTFL